MRRDGDLLLEHLETAHTKVIICAPFIKAKVLTTLLNRLEDRVSVSIVTRWLPEEVAAGVSDLEVYAIALARKNTTLSLLDHLHAKLYQADQRVLVGSANLTATALGWCSKPNLEILTSVASDDIAVLQCLEEIKSARSATEEEMLRIRLLADQMSTVQSSEAQEVDDSKAKPWLPQLAAPDRLYAAYVSKSRARLTQPTLEAADADLQALNIPIGLDQTAFHKAVEKTFLAMPSMQQILHAIESDLTDADGESLVTHLLQPLQPKLQWIIVRDWITFFLSNRYEIAPQNFIVRQRSKSER